jgi:hypothetical protein
MNSVNFNNSIAFKIRSSARDAGYQATLSKCTIYNPYVPGTSQWEHWADGYDLGILDANIEQSEMEYPANDY